MTKPSLDRTIAQLQLCIVDARALQLKMLERLLSIALLEAYELREKSDKPRDGDGPECHQEPLVRKQAAAPARIVSPAVHHMMWSDAVRASLERIGRGSPGTVRPSRAG